VLGNWLKPFHPQNFGDPKTFANSETLRKETSEVFVFMISGKFANLLLLGEKIAKRVQICKSVCHFRTMETSEIFGGFGDSRRESEHWDVVAKEGWESWMNWVKDKVPKVRIQGVNKWSACKCIKLAPQITRCKRHWCTCSHLEYSLDSRAILECKSPFGSL
jgi:hypothetical protein